MSVRLTTLAAEMIITNAAAAISSQSVKRALLPDRFLERHDVDAIMGARVVRLRMIAHRAPPHRGHFGSGAGKCGAWREPRDDLRHPVRAARTMSALRWCGLTTMLVKRST